MKEKELPDWWELHLRKARGERLSDAEEQHYAAEMVRQDQQAPLHDNFEALKELRATVAALAQENGQLRARVAALENEIQTVERSLSERTRELLGVRE